MQRFYIVLFLLFLIPLSSLAQTPGSIDSIEIRVTPEKPSPGQSVTVKIESFLTDINKANMSWIVDGKTIDSGLGKTSFTTNAPQNGRSSTITIIIKTSEGRELRRSVLLRPADVSITFESIGYTPPTYRGGTIPVYQSLVKFVAIPEFYTTAGVKIDPETLIYTWKKGSTVLGNDSGYGKQSVFIKAGVIPEPMTVSVSVQSKDSKIDGEAAIRTDFQAPEIQFYKEDPLYGILYNRAFQNSEPLTNNEFKIMSAPYYFEDTGNFVWSINGVERPDLSNQKSITFRNNGLREGKSIIGLELRGVKNILQSARKDFEVYFNKKQE